LKVSAKVKIAMQCFENVGGVANAPLVARLVWTMFQWKHTKQNPYLLVLFRSWIFF